jgi:hypothetical protein
MNAVQTTPQVAIIDNELIINLISKINTLDAYVRELKSEVNSKTKPFLSANELMELTGFSSKWVIDNKDNVGYTTIGNQLRFKRKDVEAFFEKNYIKPKKHQ